MGISGRERKAASIVSESTTKKIGKFFVRFGLPSGPFTNVSPYFASLKTCIKVFIQTLSDANKIERMKNRKRKRRKKDRNKEKEEREQNKEREKNRESGELKTGERTKYFRKK